jgi:hypothetical protein
MLQRSSSVTAAGPSPNRTGFPFRFLRTPELVLDRTDASVKVKKFLFWDKCLEIAGHCHRCRGSFHDNPLSIHHFLVISRPLITTTK